MNGIEIDPRKTYRLVKRTAKRTLYIGGTDAFDMGVTRDLSHCLQIRSQAIADSVLSWVRLYEPKANWVLEEVKEYLTTEV